MYYLIETYYVGPDRNKYIDADQIEIRTSPVTGTNGRVVVEGWYVTWGDWVTIPHGAYGSWPEAYAARREKFGMVRPAYPDRDGLTFKDKDVIGTCKPGKYAPTSPDATRNLFDIIDDLVTDYEAAANREVYTLYSALKKCCQPRGVHPVQRLKRRTSNG